MKNNSAVNLLFLAKVIPNTLSALIGVVIAFDSICYWLLANSVRATCVVKQVESGESAAPTEFLGNDVSLLKAGQEGQAAMVYFKPGVRWNQYDKINARTC